MLLDVVTNVSLTHTLAIGSFSMLDTNDIQHVPKGAFDGLPGLVTLYVTLTPDYTSHKGLCVCCLRTTLVWNAGVCTTTRLRP